MPPGVGLSRFLTAGFVPLCIWGMLSSLMLHLIEIRSLFIQGGETRLRLGVLSFAAGVILSQRLAAEQGKETANTYRWALAIVMALFTAQQAWGYRLPVHPFLVFLANGIIFAALWWVGTRITEACSVDSDEASAAATETGILARSRRLRREAPDAAAGKGGRRGAPGLVTAQQLEDRWRERLPARHPGRIIFFFSLVAIPGFGLGILLFDRAAGDGSHLGAHLFVYLWCTLALLFLSSFNQLAAYFDRRGVALPETIGATWLSVGFVTVTLVVLLAFLLPQPPSAAGGFVRERLSATWQGWEAERGLDESVKGPEPGGEKGHSPDGTEKDPVGASGGEGGERQARAQGQKEAGVDKVFVREKVSRADAAKEGAQKVFDFILKGVLILGIIGAVITAIIVLMVVGMGLREHLALLLRQRRKGRPGEKKKERREAPGAAVASSFRVYHDPFNDGVSRADNELVHYLWDATLAFCADAGSPCPPHQTPYEFLDSRPAPLMGLEDRARDLVSWLMHADYSGEPLPDAAREDLRRYWKDLHAHANGARSAAAVR